MVSFIRDIDLDEQIYSSRFVLVRYYLCVLLIYDRITSDAVDSVGRMVHNVASLFLIVYGSSVMGIMRDLHQRYGAPRWVYIYYAIGYVFIFTVATLVLNGVIKT